MDTRAKLNAGLGCGLLLITFVIALLAFGLAYQAKPTYFIDIGTRLDQAYVVPKTFNTKEPPEDKRTADSPNYRWTNGESKLYFPGIGSQDLIVTLNLLVNENDPSTRLTVLVNGQALPLPVLLPPPNQLTEVKFSIPANLFSNGNLTLTFKSIAWKPKGDSRDLGLYFDWVKIEPLNPNFWAFVRPPADVFTPLLITVVLFGLIFLVIGIPLPYALLGLCGLIAGGAYWLVADRLTLTTLLTQDFIHTLFFMWLGVYLLAEFAPRVFKLFGVTITRRDSAWLAALFLLYVVLLYGFMLHPQFWSSDIGLNVNRLLFVRDGKFVFAEPLPDGQLAPYPPAYYFVLLPFSFGNSALQLEGIIKFASSLIYASSIYLVFYLAALLRRPPIRVTQTDIALNEHRELGSSTNWAAIAAAAIFMVSRYPFFIFSQGNHTNLFGAWAFLLFVCLLAATLNNFKTRQTTNIPAPIETEIITTEISVKQAVAVSINSVPLPKLSPSMIAVNPVRARGLLQLRQIWRVNYLPNLLIVGRYSLPYLALLLVFLSHYGTFLFTNAFLLVLTLLQLIFGGTGKGRVTLYLLFVWLLALSSAFALYYYNHLGLITDQINRILKGLPPPGNKPRPPYDFFSTIQKFISESRLDFGTIILIGVLGSVLISLVTYGFAANRLWAKISPVSLVLVAVAIASLLFAIFGPAAGQTESRYQLYLLPVLALVGGAFFGRVWRTSPAGVMLVCALLLFQLIETLAFWLARVNYYFIPNS